MRIDAGQQEQIKGPYFLKIDFWKPRLGLFNGARVLNSTFNP